MSNRRRFLIFLVLSPGIWWVLLQPRQIIEQIRSIPASIRSNISSPARSEYMRNIQDMRWGGITVRRNNIISRVYYSKLAMIPKEVFDYIQFLTPRMYFLTGDGSNFSPSRLEPISTLLFPFWVGGVITLVKKKQYKPFLVSLVTAALSFIIGRKNFVFLFPVMVAYIYMASVGWDVIPEGKLKKMVMYAVIAYGIYITEMAIWLRPLS